MGKKTRNGLKGLVLALALSAGITPSAEAWPKRVSFSNVTENLILVPELQQEYLVQGSSEANGSVVGNTNDWLVAGKTAIVYAIPNNLYSFNRWSNGSANNPFVYQVTSPTNLVASFKPALTSQGTPLLWYDGFGRTNDFELADSNDLDGDGFTGRQEYTADTNPEDSLDSLPFLTITTSPEEVYLDISKTSVNRNYSIDATTNMITGPWEEKEKRQGNGASQFFEFNREDPRISFYRSRIGLP